MSFNTTDKDLTVFASLAIGAATTTSGVDAVNYEHRGAILVLEVTQRSGDAVITDVLLQSKMSDGTYVTVQDWSALAINATGNSAFLVYPGAAGTAGWKAAPASMPLPGAFRVQLVTTWTNGTITAAVVAKLQN